MNMEAAGRERDGPFLRPTYFSSCENMLGGEGGSHFIKCNSNVQRNRFEHTHERAHTHTPTHTLRIHLLAVLPATAALSTTTSPY